MRGSHHDGGAVSEIGQQPRGPFEHLLDLAVRVLEKLAHLSAPVRIQRAGACQMVDEEPVALVGGNPPRTGVGLGEEAVSFQRRHVRSDGGRRHADACRLDHVLGAHRLSRRDVLGDDRLEDGRFADVEITGLGGACFVAAVCGGCHGIRCGRSNLHPTGSGRKRSHRCWHSTLVSADPFGTAIARMRPNSRAIPGWIRAEPGWFRTLR